LRGDEALEFVELVGDFFAGHPVLLANDFAVVGGGGIPVFYVNRTGFGEAGELAEGVILAGFGLGGSCHCQFSITFDAGYQAEAATVIHLRYQIEFDFESSNIANCLLLGIPRKQ
jgi:hypothetical protein